MMEKDVFFENRSGERLSGYLHEPENPNKAGLVLAHCFACTKHISVMRKACDLLAKNGFLVLRFDFSGNGESEGKFEEATYSKEMGDLDSAITFMLSNGVDKIGVMGHSMGAAVALLHASRDNRVKSLCVVSGVSDTRMIRSLFSEKQLGCIEEDGSCVVNLFGKDLKITKEWLDDACEHDLEEALRRLYCPFCVIHGDNDKVIGVENGKKLYEFAHKPKEMHIIKKADHLFKGKIDELDELVVDWFQRTMR